jgi:cytochrome P450
MMHDPSDYPDPSAFQPERYLTRPPSGGWARRDDVSDPRAIAFGFGRRACPGTSIAQQGLFATLAPMLHTLDILPVAEGKGIPRLETDRGLLALPEPFDYAIRIRSDAEGLINTFSEV